MNNAEHLLLHDNYRTVAMVELFSNWTLNLRIPNNPVANNMNVLHEWIKSNDESKISYCISACATLSTPESINLLELATTSRYIDVRLEALFSLIILRVNKYIDDIKQMAFNPLISIKALEYIIELNDSYSIDCPLTEEDVLDSLEDPVEFQSKAALANWCAHPQEFGRHPDMIRIWHVEKIYWLLFNKETVVY